MDKQTERALRDLVGAYWRLEVYGYIGHEVEENDRDQCETWRTIARDAADRLQPILITRPTEPVMIVAQPCPFCGGIKLTCDVESKYQWNCACWIVCSDCLAIGPVVFLSDDQLDNAFQVALSHWNRRATPPSRA
jgi:hypothetical protein